MYNNNVFLAIFFLQLECSTFKAIIIYIIFIIVIYWGLFYFLLLDQTKDLVHSKVRHQL